MRAVLCSAFTGPDDLQIGDIEEPTPADDEPVLIERDDEPGVVLINVGQVP